MAGGLGEESSHNQRVPGSEGSEMVDRFQRSIRLILRAKTSVDEHFNAFQLSNEVSPGDFLSVTGNINGFG